MFIIIEDKNFLSEDKNHKALFNVIFSIQNGQKQTKFADEVVKVKNRENRDLCNIF
jgi:hypothetical protein